MVGLHVSVQVRLLVEALIAVGELAWEWFLPGVDPLVGLKVEVEAESFSADFALVRLLTRVNQHVPLQLCIVQESLLAPGMHARIQLVPMHSHVFLETGPIVEDLPARL